MRPSHSGELPRSAEEFRWSLGSGDDDRQEPGEPEELSEALSSSRWGEDTVQSWLGWVPLPVSSLRFLFATPHIFFTPLYILCAIYCAIYYAIYHAIYYVHLVYKISNTKKVYILKTLHIYNYSEYIVVQEGPLYSYMNYIHKEF